MLIFIRNCTVGSWYLIVVVVLTKDYWHHQRRDSIHAPFTSAFNLLTSLCMKSEQLCSVLENIIHTLQSSVYWGNSIHRQVPLLILRNTL
jgi:hypothetical protein